MADDDKEPPTSQRKHVVYAESFDPNKNRLHSTDEKFPKSPVEAKKILENLRKCFLFDRVSDEELMRIIDTMPEVKCTAGTVVIKEGDPGDFFYVIGKGSFEVTIKGKYVSTYVDGGGFGELALMYNTGRQATVTAKTDGILWAMKRQTFKLLVVQAAHEKRKLYDQFLTKVKILKNCTAYERAVIADAIKTRNFTKGQNIFTAGQASDGLYFIETGSLVENVENAKTKAVHEVRKLARGDHFGEVEMINKAPRSTTVTALEDVQLAFLSSDAFDRIMDPCKEAIRRESVAIKEKIKKFSTGEVKIK